MRNFSTFLLIAGIALAGFTYFTPAQAADGPNAQQVQTVQHLDVNADQVNIQVKSSYPERFFAWIGFGWSLFFFFILAIIVGACAENDSEGWAAVLTLLILASIWWGGVVDHSVFTVKNITEFVLAYIAIGFCWAFVKWVSYGYSQRKEFVALKNAWAKMSDTEKEKYKGLYAKRTTFQNYLTSNSYRWARYDDFMPVAMQMKAKLTTWMAWWFASFIWTVLNKWIIQLWETIVEVTSGMMDNIMKRIYKNALQDIDKDVK